MYKNYQLGWLYFKYRLKALNGKGHGTHSPFVYTFIREVLNDKRKFYCYSGIEFLRRQLLADKKKIVVEDFGAGSKLNKTKERTIAAIAYSSLKPKKYAQLLFRMVNYYQPKTIVELGTSLGITSSYLASGNTNATVYTFEGSSSVATKAKENFTSLKLENIDLTVGNFDDTLSAKMAEMNTIDFAFLDGNHRYEPTINYFEQILTKSNDDTMVILDDIHWSKEMEEAWAYVQNHPRVTTTIDLFFIGVVFFRKEFKNKQLFVIKY